MSKLPLSRRAFDPSRHCGAPKDRSIETLQARMVKNQAFVDEVQLASEERELTALEKIRLKRKLLTLSYGRTQMEKLERFGPDDRPCMLKKGQKTSHPGIGLCYLHCECLGKADWHFDDKFTYSPKNRKLRLRKVMDDMEAANHDLMDMQPLLLLLSAKVKDFSDQKGDDLDPETVKSLSLLTEQIRKTVDSMNDRRFKASISMDVYNLILFKMAEVLMKHVQDQELIERITADWERISVETGSKRAQAVIAGRREE